MAQSQCQQTQAKHNGWTVIVMSVAVVAAKVKLDVPAIRITESAIAVTRRLILTRFH
jgi:hypothetical protein